MRRLFLLILLLFIWPAGRPAAAEAADPNAVAAELARFGDALVAEYDAADGEATAERFYDLYFDVFEGRGLEAEIGAENPALKMELEAQFSFIIDLLYRGVPRPELAKHWGVLRDDVAAAAHTLSRRGERGAWAVLFQAALIMLREGAEAAVVIAAMIAAVHRRGLTRGERMIWAGAAAAVAAAGLTAWSLPVLGGGNAQAREALEGSVHLLAALTLALAAHWLRFGDTPERWARLAGSAGLLPLAGAAFLATYREGAEIILFHQVLLAGAQHHQGMAALGIAAGILGLGAICLLYRVASPRLPPTAFLAVTAVPLFILAVVFVGRGIFALQSVGLMPTTLLPWGPTISWLGLFPSAEGLAAQAMMAVLLASVTLPLTVLRRRTTTSDA